jgi:hypothetical protein
MVKVVAEVTDQVWLPVRKLEHDPAFFDWNKLPWLMTVGVGQ